MNDKEYAVTEALDRISTFGTQHASAFPAGSEGAKDFARVDPLRQEIGNPDQQPGNTASPATSAKSALFEEVREDLEAIAATARTIALKGNPGFDTSFTLGPDTQRQILSDAETFLAHLADSAVVAKFTAFSMDPDFVQDLRDDLQAISGFGSEQHEDLQTDTGSTARVRALIKEARLLIKSLDSSVSNRFRRDPEILAQWRTASHIRRSPRKREEQAPSPLPNPA